jgi:hypothetical protein
MVTLAIVTICCVGFVLLYGGLFATTFGRRFRLGVGLVALAFALFALAAIAAIAVPLS